MGSDNEEDKCLVCGYPYQVKVSSKKKSNVYVEEIRKYVSHQDQGVMFLHDPDNINDKQFSV